MNDVAVAFDLDRTLVELAVDIDAVRDRLAALFSPHGYAGSFTPILPGIDRAARAVSRGPDEARQWVARGRGLIDDAELAAPLVVRPGAADLIETLARVNIAMGLVTDNGRACATRALRVLGMTAQAVASRDDVAEPKPSPEGMLAVAARLLPGRGTLWVIGDSVRDMRAVARARAALPGIQWRALGVTGGRDPSAALVHEGAERVLESLAELAGILGIDRPAR